MRNPERLRRFLWCAFKETETVLRQRSNRMSTWYNTPPASLLQFNVHLIINYTLHVGSSSLSWSYYRVARPSFASRRVGKTWHLPIQTRRERPDPKLKGFNLYLPGGRSISALESEISAAGDSSVECRHLINFMFWCASYLSISEHLDTYISPQLSVNFGFPPLQFLNRHRSL